MIWFRCKKCGKEHGRSDSLAGTMIFCECGQGLTVPWASTIAEPEPTPAPIPLPPARDPLPAVPLPVDESAPRRPSIPVPSNPPAPSMPGQRRRPWRKVNPAYCFNHDDTASSVTCADCRVAFCPACVVSFQGQTVCSPCKNFRVRGATRPPRTSALAIVALVVALASGPVALCLSFFAIGSHVQSQSSVAMTVALTLLGTLLPAGALVLGGFALRDVETKPNVSGRGMAMTGAIAALAGVLWNLTAGILLIIKQVQG